MPLVKSFFVFTLIFYGSIASCTSASCRKVSEALSRVLQQRVAPDELPKNENPAEIKLRYALHLCFTRADSIELLNLLQEVKDIPQNDWPRLKPDIYQKIVSLRKKIARSVIGPYNEILEGKNAEAASPKDVDTINREIDRLNENAGLVIQQLLLKGEMGPLSRDQVPTPRPPDSNQISVKLRQKLLADPFLADTAREILDLWATRPDYNKKDEWATFQEKLDDKLKYFVWDAKLNPVNELLGRIVASDNFENDAQKSQLYGKVSPKSEEADKKISEDIQKLLKDGKFRELVPTR